MMVVFLTVFSMLCAYTDALLCTRSSTSEDISYCYEAQVICNNYTDMNGKCKENTIISVLHRGPGSYTVFYEMEFLTAGFQPEVASFRLCHREALRLTQNDLKCGNQCSVSVDVYFTRAFTFTCSDLVPENLIDIGLTIILFKMKTDMMHVHTCVNQTKYKFAVVDTRGNS